MMLNWPLTQADDDRAGFIIISSSLLSKSGLICLQIDVSTLLESLVLIFRFISSDNFKLVLINCEHVWIDEKKTETNKKRTLIRAFFKMNVKYFGFQSLILLAYDSTMFFWHFVTI